MKWQVDNGVVSKLYVDGENLINPWGIETADSWSFFSMEKGIGYRHQRMNERIDFNEKQYAASLESKMREGRWKLELNDQIVNSSKLVRKAELTTVEDSVLMDFVMRFRFLKSKFDSATIDGRTFTHRNTNIYNQYKCNKVTLIGKNNTIEINIKSSHTDGGLIPHMYVRDRGDEWIVHCRMLPSTSHKDVIKLCNKWCRTSPIPQALTDLLLKIKKIRAGLWYRGERSPFTSRIMRVLNPNAFPMALVKEGSRIAWEVELSLK